MKKLLPIILLVFAVSAFAQKPAKLPREFEVKYDKFKDVTHVSFMELGVGSNMSIASNVSIDVSFLHDGQILASDASEFYFYFSAGRCYGFCFNKPSLIFMIDGERLPPLVDEGTLDDSVIFEISRPLMTRIATAKLVEFQVGGYEGKLKDKSLERMKLLLDLGTVKKGRVLNVCCYFK